MRYLLLTLTIGLAAPFGMVHAEDFTGFYAGVNAGYARGRDRDGAIGAPVSSPDTAGTDDARGLPPSALSASQALQRGSANGRTSSRR